MGFIKTFLNRNLQWRHASTSKIALLIDGQNIQPKWAGPIYDEICQMGDPIIRRVYGNFYLDQRKAWAAPAHALGLACIQHVQQVPGKNAVDIEMVIDALELTQRKTVHTIVVASSDSDFARLATTIRERGFRYIGIGAFAAPDAYRALCSRFIELSDLRPVEELAGPEHVSRRKQRKVLKRLLKMILTRNSNSADWMDIKELREKLEIRFPAFDPRSFAYREFRDLLRDMEETELKSLRPGMWLVRWVGRSASTGSGQRAESGPGESEGDAPDDTQSSAIDPAH